MHLGSLHLAVALEALTRAIHFRLLEQQRAVVPAASEDDCNLWLVGL